MKFSYDSKNNKKGISLAISFTIGLVLGALLVYVYISTNEAMYEEYTISTEKIPKNPNYFDDVDLDSFWNTWKLIEENFIPSPDSKWEEPKKGDIVYDAIRGLTLYTEDPFTSFLPPVEADEFSDEVVDGEISGIGAYIGIRDNLPTIISTIKNSPAERAGLKGGDKRIKVDENDTEGLDPQATARLIKGKIGTSVELTIYDGSGLKTVDIVRERVEIPSIKTFVEDDVFILEFSAFTKNTAFELRDGLNEFLESGTDRLIIDLRSNPGGLINVAVYAIGLFTPDKTVAIYEYDGNDRLKRYVTPQNSLLGKKWDKETIVLVNRGTASSSEIVAAALRHYGIAEIVGTKTFGKGSVQKLIPVDKDGAVLKVTIAHWLTPAKESISEDGIEPDINFSEDGTLENAIEVRETDEERDVFLERAIEIIKGK